MLEFCQMLPFACGQLLWRGAVCGEGQLAQGDWRLLWGEDFERAGFFQMSVDLEVLDIVFWILKIMLWVLKIMLWVLEIILRVVEDVFGFILIFRFVVGLVFGDGFEEVAVLGHGWD